MKFLKFKRTKKKWILDWIKEERREKARVYSRRSRLPTLAETEANV